MTKRLAVIRIRGRVNVSREVAHTLDMLGLRRVNHAVFIDDRPSYRGMLQKIKDYVTWGEVDAGDVALILRNRGEVIGGKRLTDDYVKEKTPFKSIEDFAGRFVDFKAELEDIPGLKKVFRLHPPRKGHGSIKKAYSMGGSLGNRGGEIKGLIRRMR
ncbi:MAG: 50S ribosomal protein L30 [Methanobacteriota archaeon]|nr:MAG: 50S ribosomal protein L30 [Euryarchaeota archaeon]